jgi:hypothetical protein
MSLELIYNLIKPWRRRKAGERPEVELILKAARQLPVEQQLELAERLLAGANGGAARKTAEPGRARRHFGAWDSGDERSADNDRIDRDLAREYGDPPTHA